MSKTDDQLDASSPLTDSGTEADIDEAAPTLNTLSRDRDRRDPDDDRYIILRLLRYELESWKEPDAFLQEMVGSFIEGRICGQEEFKQIILRYLEVKFKIVVPNSPDSMNIVRSLTISQLVGSL